MKILTLILMLSLTTCGMEKDKSASSPKDSFQAKTFQANDNVDLLYNIYYPEQANEKVPLFIFLHGAGERGNDNSSQLIHIAPILTNEYNKQKYPAILVFPQCPAGEYWANVNTESGQWLPESSGDPTPPMQRVIELIESMKMNPSVDTDRIYISGLSMGGFGTFDLLARHPDWFAGAIAICGGADLNSVENYKNTPLWIFHGDSDSVVPVELSRKTAEKLRSMKGKVKYTEVPGGGHNVWNEAYEDKETLQWLFNLSK